MGFLLYLIATLLFLPLTAINVVVVAVNYHKKKQFFKTVNDYFFTGAVDIDRFGNHNFRTLWNAVLRKDIGYKFGNQTETISSALGKNQLAGTLTRTGRVLCFILDFLDENHCYNSINNLDHKKPKTMSKLNQPTPRENVFLWKIGSLFYLISILINENYSLICELGFSEKTEKIIRIFGIVLYALFTFYNFNKSTFDQKLK